ncbi:MAG: CPBP family intramembrane metalloprotease [Gammaproteobacteria bacterium]|nr:CPBP family intramembrane metalloprotease [Gammaproteobacteria bacterium]
MEPVDHIFILLLFVVQPIYGVFEARSYKARANAGQPLNRVRFYRQTALLEWVFLAALVTVWFTFDRPIVDLGFAAAGGPGFWGGAALLILLSGILLNTWRIAKRTNDTDKAEQAESLGEILQFLPHTTRELHNFVGVSITAGIVEEIVYRGFVLWYLAQVMPLWVAVAVSSVAFGLAHSYQGATGALRTGLIGLAFGIFYVVTGSIWLPIVAHVLLDVLQGAAIHELLRKDDDGLESPPA